ncbi:hypothetical protein T484DRAFT_1804151, partial [Baffinella frigidus]
VVRAAVPEKAGAELAGGGGGEGRGVIQDPEAATKTLAEMRQALNGASGDGESRQAAMSYMRTSGALAATVRVLESATAALRGGGGGLGGGGLVSASLSLLHVAAGQEASRAYLLATGRLAPAISLLDALLLQLIEASRAYLLATGRLAPAISLLDALLLQLTLYMYSTWVRESAEWGAEELRQVAEVLELLCGCLAPDVTVGDRRCTGSVQAAREDTAARGDTVHPAPQLNFLDVEARRFAWASGNDAGSDEQRAMVIGAMVIGAWNGQKTGGAAAISAVTAGTKGKNAEGREAGIDAERLVALLAAVGVLSGLERLQVWGAQALTAEKADQREAGARHGMPNDHFRLLNLSLSLLQAVTAPPPGPSGDGHTSGEGSGSGAGESHESSISKVDMTLES